MNSRTTLERSIRLFWNLAKSCILLSLVKISFEPRDPSIASLLVWKLLLWSFFVFSYLNFSVLHTYSPHFWNFFDKTRPSGYGPPLRLTKLNSESKLPDITKNRTNHILQLLAKFHQNLMKRFQIMSKKPHFWIFLVRLRFPYIKATFEGVLGKKIWAQDCSGPPLI